MPENYIKWEPIEGIENETWVEALFDDYNNLRIILKGSRPSQKAISISFKNYFLYRNIDESYRLKLWKEGGFDQRDWPLFTVSNSNLIDWLCEENGGVYGKDEMKHYFIKTGADVIDVVANNVPPVIERVEWADIVDKKETGVAVPAGAILVKRGKRGSYFDKE